MPNIKKALEEKESQINAYLAEKDYSEPDVKAWCNQQLKEMLLLHLLAEKKNGADNEYTDAEFQQIMTDSDWFHDPDLNDMLNNTTRQQQIQEYMQNPAIILKDFGNVKRSIEVNNQLKAMKSLLTA